MGIRILNRFVRISLVIGLIQGFFILTYSLPEAWAGMGELTGIGIRSQSMAGSGVALNIDPSACYYNPAGLTGLSFNDGLGFNLELGVSTFDLKAYTKHSTEERHTPRGLDSATNLNLSMACDIGRHLSDYIGNRALVMGVSVLVTPWLSIGASANFLLELETDTIGPAYITEDDLNKYTPGLGGDGSETYVVMNATLGEAQKTMLEISPIVGIQIRPADSLILGLTYRGELYMDDYGFNLIMIHVQAEGIPPIETDFQYYHHFAHYYTPDQWALGLSYRFSNNLLVTTDVTFMKWSTFLDYFHHRPVNKFKDVYLPRIGIEKCILKRQRLIAGLHGDMILRAGYGFWNSPVPEQRGETNFLDNDKHILALGCEWALDNLGRWWKKPVSINSMFQYHYLIERTYHKLDTGERLKLGGYAYTTGITMEFKL